MDIWYTAGMQSGARARKSCERARAPRRRVVRCSLGLTKAIRVQLPYRNLRLGFTAAPRVGVAHGSWVGDGWELLSEPELTAVYCTRTRQEQNHNVRR